MSNKKVGSAVLLSAQILLRTIFATWTLFSLSRQTTLIRTRVASKIYSIQMATWILICLGYDFFACHS